MKIISFAAMKSNTNKLKVIRKKIKLKWIRISHSLDVYEKKIKKKIILSIQITKLIRTIGSHLLIMEQLSVTQQ